MRWLVSHMGAIFLTGFFALIVGAFVLWVVIPASNVGNSGEGGVGLILFALPWLNNSGYSFFYGIAINAGIFYLVGRGVGAILKKVFFKD